MVFPVAGVGTPVVVGGAGAGAGGATVDIDGLRHPERHPALAGVVLALDITHPLPVILLALCPPGYVPPASATGTAAATAAAAAAAAAVTGGVGTGGDVIPAAGTPVDSDPGVFGGKRILKQLKRKDDDSDDDDMFGGGGKKGGKKGGKGPAGKSGGAGKMGGASVATAAGAGDSDRGFVSVGWFSKLADEWYTIVRAPLDAVVRVSAKRQDKVAYDAVRGCNMSHAMETMEYLDVRLRAGLICPCFVSMF